MMKEEVKVIEDRDRPIFQRGLFPAVNGDVVEEMEEEEEVGAIEIEKAPNKKEEKKKKKKIGKQCKWAILYFTRIG